MGVLLQHPLRAASALPAVDDMNFRDAMAGLASGVAVVACQLDGAPRGLLVSSLTALSTEPPRLLFCVRKEASSHAAMLKVELFSLSILAEHQKAEADRFSRPHLAHERFDPKVWRLDDDAPPHHPGALISLDGVLGQRLDAGTHTVFILNVRGVEVRKGRPLVYFDRDLHGLTALAASA